MSASDKYPPITDSSSIAKNWMDALLQDCGERRMKQIAKDFALTGYSNLQKEPLFKFLFNHMLTVQDCGVCGGDCDPLTHKFPAIEAPPTGARKSPSPSPKQTRHGRKTANLSPTSLVGE